MNGAFARAFFSFGEPAPGVHFVTDGKRLYVAFALSCLLHAALVLAPYHGTGAEVAPGAAARGAPPPRTAPRLDVRLERAGESGAAAAGKPAASSRTRGSDRLPIPAPTYYLSGQLTRSPRPTAEPNLQVPQSIARAVTGRVVLKLWIDERGRVELAEVESSNLPEKVAG